MAMMSGALLGAADAALAVTIDAITTKTATEKRIHLRMTVPPEPVSMSTQMRQAPRSGDVRCEL